VENAREALRAELARATSGRRFKEALEAPFWTTLYFYITGRLWRALGHPSPFLAPPVPMSFCCAVKHGRVRSTLSLCSRDASQHLTATVNKALQARPEQRAPGLPQVRPPALAPGSGSRRKAPP